MEVMMIISLFIPFFKGNVLPVTYPRLFNSLDLLF